MCYYFMSENKRRNKFLIEYLKLFATDRHWLNIIVTARYTRDGWLYTEGRWTGSVNACIFACLILSFTVG